MSEQTPRTSPAEESPPAPTIKTEASTSTGMFMDERGCKRRKRAPASSRLSVRAACQRCRTRKVACDGQRPKCARCHGRLQDCFYDTQHEGETRMSALKRQNDALRREVESLNIIIAGYKSAETSKSPVTLVEQSVSPQPTMDSESLIGHLTLYLNEIPTQHSLQPRLSTLAEAADISRRNPIASTTLEHSHQPLVPTRYCHELLYQLDVTYWTSIPIPNDLAASAISTYFDTEHFCTGAFDMTLFLNDLVHKKLEFCSPLLFASLMSLALQTHSTLTPKPHPFIHPFYDSAKTLSTTAPPHSTTIPSLLLLATASSRLGYSEESNHFLHQAASSAPKQAS